MSQESPFHHIIKSGDKLHMEQRKWVMAAAPQPGEPLVVKPDCRPTGKLLHSSWSSEDVMPLKPILCRVTEIGGKINEISAEQTRRDLYLLPCWFQTVSAEHKNRRCFCFTELSGC